MLADADLERAANAALFWSMQNTGQTCISVERVYAEEPIYDRFVALVADKARGLRQGVPGGFGSVDVGSFTNPPQVDASGMLSPMALGCWSVGTVGRERVRSSSRRCSSTSITR